MTKKQKKTFIIFILSLCLFIQTISGDILKNPKCTTDNNKIYYKDFDTPECIAQIDCKKSYTNKIVYLTGSDDYVCKNNDDYCKPQYNNKPGYTKTTKENYFECQQCPKDKPISNGTTCGQCLDQTIFTYVQLEGQNNACVALTDIQKQQGNLLNGVFSIDKKIYYQSDYICPNNQIKSIVIYQYNNKPQTFNKCNCPLEMPVLNNDGICVKCSDEQISDEMTQTCIGKNACQNILSIDSKICYKSTCPLGQFIDKTSGKSKCNTCAGSIPLSDGITCSNTCSPGQIYVNFETKKCLASCPQDLYQDREIFTGSNFYYCYKKCLNDKLQFISLVDGKRECIKQSECTLKINLDKTQCTSDCQTGQVAYQEGTLTICYLAGKDCSGKTYNFVYKNYTICSNTCNYFMVDKTGSQVCQEDCSSENFILDQNKNDSFRVCSETCSTDFTFTDEKNVKYCLKKCPKLTYQFIDSQNKKFCIKKCNSYVYTVSDQEVCKGSCENTDYVLEQVKGETFRRCSTDCNGHEYDNGDKIKRCYEKCPNNQVFERKQKKCLNSKKDCQTFISVKRDQCIDTCDSKKFEYPIQMEGFKQCFTCNGYYNDLEQSCSQTCGIGQIGFPSLHQCLDKENGKAKCTSLNFKLSSDETICSEACQYPEIQNSEGKCKSPCKTQDSSCNDCKTNQYILATGNKQVCVNTCGELFISSDNKRCIKDCSIIKEQNPQNNTKVCIKCKGDEVLINNPQSENTYICKKSNSPDILTDKVSFIKTQLKTQIDSISSFQSIKDQVAEIAKDTFKKAQETNNKSTKQLIDEVINLAKQTISNISITELQNIPHKIGSKDNIIVQLQTKATGYKFKSNLDIDQIQNNNTYSFTEQITDGKEDILPSLATTILAFNPACQNEQCKQYPLFQLDTTAITSRLLLETTQDFTVTFNLQSTKDIKKYICLSYDLDNPNNTPKITKTTIINDNKSISCLVNGSVSVFFDLKCEYINKSLCEILNEDNNDDGLNGGQIAGIVIGCVVFIGLVVLIILQIIKIKKEKNKKKYLDNQNNNKNNNHLELQSDPNIPTNTLTNICQNKQKN